MVKKLISSFTSTTSLQLCFLQRFRFFLTYGEDLVIETARHHREFIQDPILKQRVTSLIGQEAIHSNCIMSSMMQLKSWNIRSIFIVSWVRTSLNMCS